MTKPTDEKSKIHNLFPELKQKSYRTGKSTTDPFDDLISELIDDAGNFPTLTPKNAAKFQCQKCGTVEYRNSVCCRSCKEPLKGQILESQINTQNLHKRKSFLFSIANLIGLAILPIILVGLLIPNANTNSESIFAFAITSILAIYFYINYNKYKKLIKNSSFLYENYNL